MGIVATEARGKIHLSPMPEKIGLHFRQSTVYTLLLKCPFINKGISNKSTYQPLISLNLRAKHLKFS